VKKDILTILDLTKEDVDGLLGRAFELKRMREERVLHRPLEGKTLGLIFDKASTRTRVSFESAMIQLGGTPLFISARDTQIARDEPARDTARVLSRYLDCLAVRTFSQDLLEELAEYSSIPVINALTDLYHPCQVLSDIMTVIEKKGGYKGLKIAWIGDGNNVAHSWINAASVLGLDLILACPEDYRPDAEILKRAVEEGTGRIRITGDPLEAARGADVIYTDVWASMGQEGESKARARVFAAYQVNRKVVGHASKDVIVMHCLPAHRDEEISDEVLEGPSSVVWDQAENKLHMTKAILEALVVGGTGENESGLSDTL
jgi:ornithine carbamoyltransferase